MLRQTFYLLRSIFLVAAMLSQGRLYGAEAGALLTSTSPVCDTVVEFVNFYPGADIYQLEGHSALRIRTPETDVAVTYGMFNFNEPGFVFRYVKGETDYWVGVVNWEPFLDSYIREGRRVVSHRLNMTSEQKARLIDLIGENLMPANRVYRYNYVLDNCATRPLTIVERAMGDSVALTKAPAPLDGEDESFRSVMRHYHERYPWYQFGIDLALGSGIDRPISNREKSFAPVVLDTQLSGATVGSRPLVEKTEVLNDVPADNALEETTPWPLRPLTVSLAVMILMFVWAWRDFNHRRPTRLFYALFFLILGLAGCLLTFLVFISEHYATSPNALLLWLNPLALTIPAMIWFKACRRLTAWYMMLNCALIIIMILIWPFINQQTNVAFWPLIMGDLAVSAVYAVTVLRPAKTR